MMPNAIALVTGMAWTVRARCGSAGIALGGQSRDH